MSNVRLLESIAAGAIQILAEHSFVCPTRTPDAHVVKSPFIGTILMPMNVAETKQVFPYAQEQVFNALLAVLGPAGFEVKTNDRVLGRITASAGMSAFSWGEDLVVQVVKRDEASSELSVSSHLKVGVNLAATAKNAKNAERIISAVSNYLQGGGRDVARAVSEAPPASSPPVLWVIAGLIFLLMLFSIAIM